ncbi:hypothetical protein EDD11_010269 [Mortierella claussenii]|nr:hypothetical protein EDD11_010269 [Mortierella claussenii]
MLNLWKVSLPVMLKKERKEISLADVPSKQELEEKDDVSDVFKDPPPEKTIHRPATTARITDTFFAPGPAAKFLDASVKGEGTLPVTSGSAGELPRAWRCGFVIAPEINPACYS